ncbi:hypothetical protein ONZ43_g6414 [Nemania bipapillata]|uniref:Uncharacterized protein n=1 Tax=Nemania bipapillata TaxID=110536 RepID=A0ACC2HZN2_9PEZI|nr:hypothetical protein ONZ43_g6414 [Nemania bipapillata]
MRTFTWTPQALAMKAMVSRLPRGATPAETFSTPYLDACVFEEREGGEDLAGSEPPEGWTGPVVTGVLDCGFVVEEKGGEGFVRFVNETVLWRRKDEKPTLLEGTVSRWLHTVMIAWMMVRGVEAVTAPDSGVKVKMT